MQELTINLPGKTIAIKAHGDSKNPVILALHGWLDNANSFDGLAEVLSRHFYILAMDIPGHGYSSHIPPGCHYHFIDGIYTVIDVIKALPATKVHLLGHSMGACLASLIAGIAPELISSVALIEGLGPFSSPETTAHLQLRDYLIHQSPGEVPPRLYHSLETAAKARAKRGHVSLDIAKQLCARGIELRDNLYAWRHDRRLLTPSPLRLTEEQILSILREIKAPAWLLWANQGFNFTSELLEKRMQAISDLSVLHLDGGHHIHMENPLGVAQGLLKFYSIGDGDGVGVGAGFSQEE